MNNNYHTQIDKQNNMLTEIAASNQLLQKTQQMQNFQGTPIRQNTQPAPQVNPQTNQQMMPQYAQNPQQLQQQFIIAQQLAQQAQQGNMYPQQQINMPPAALPNVQSNPQYNDNDEIELSDPRPRPKQPTQLLQEQQPTGPTCRPDEPEPQPDQINQPNQVPQNARPQHQPPNKNIDPREIINPNRLSPRRLRHKPAPAPTTNNTTEYLILPFILLLCFVGLVHPSTAKYLDKYLPSMKDTKGIFVRGMILAIIYVAIKMGLSMMK
jgi:hypothetical protein